MPRLLCGERCTRSGSTVTPCCQRHIAGAGAPGGTAAGKNLATLGAKSGRVVNTNTLQFLAQKGDEHQLVFIDPPFRQGLLEKTTQLLESNGWLSDGALVYVESEVEHGIPPVPVNWQLHREKIAGQVAYRLYIRHRVDKEISNAD